MPYTPDVTQHYTFEKKGAIVLLECLGDATKGKMVPKFFSQSFPPPAIQAKLNTNYKSATSI